MRDDYQGVSLRVVVVYVMTLLRKLMRSVSLPKQKFFEPLSFQGHDPKKRHNKFFGNPKTGQTQSRRKNFHRNSKRAKIQISGEIQLKRLLIPVQRVFLR